MDKISQNFRWYLIAVLCLSTCFIWYVNFSSPSKGVLKIAMLDIGQGDAIFVEAPNGNQMLIDGGPPKTILSALKRVMPFYDRSIDIVLVTNPDTDHMGGFIDVLKNYSVDEVVEPGTISESATYSELVKMEREKKIERVVAERGETIWLDKKNGVGFHILFPDRNVSGLAINDGSIVGKLIYGDTSVMFTGDSPQKIERYLVSLGKKDLDSDILKVGHHGSRTSTSPEFVSAVSPEIAIISDGAGNKYGHPHKETLDTLEKAGVEVLRTDLVGTIILESDGKGWRLVK